MVFVKDNSVELISYSEARKKILKTFSNKRLWGNKDDGSDGYLSSNPDSRVNASISTPYVKVLL